MKKKLISTVFVFCAFASVWSQQILEPDVLGKVLASVFEVVVEKPVEKNIEYERDLPWARIAFSIRNDAYLPLGTAFLLDTGEFYSAAHVFSLYEDSLYTDYYIRDGSGKTFKVDTVTKFSTNRDFISFTVEDYTPEQGAGLAVADVAEMNSVVFSVGNALGDGIVIRNGILTSRTYEVENGEWKWLRFSAAASPGNSGGPLITADGRVLGIVTMKSENENLNYALPFAETDSVEAGVGFMYNSFYYSLPNVLSEKFYHIFDHTVSLPKKLKDVQSELTEAFNAYVTDVAAGVRKQFNPLGRKGFVSASGSAEILSNYFLMKFPYTLYLNEAGKWDYGYPSSQVHQLPGNGTVQFGNMMGLSMGIIQKPDNVSMAELLSNPKLYMDYSLAADKITRNFNSEKIAVTTLGQPAESSSYVDYFGRTWQVNLWRLGFADSALLCYALPLPNGIYYMYDIASTGTIAACGKNDMSFVADFVYPCYTGKISEWQEFLSLPQELAGVPVDFLREFKIEMKADSVSIDTGVFTVDIPQSVLPLNEDSYFRATCAYTMRDDKLIFDNRSFDVFTNRRTDNYKYMNISKLKKPAAGALKNTVEIWEQKRDRITPFNSEPYNYEQYTYCDKVLYPAGVSFENRTDADVVYLLCTELGGQNKFEEISRFSERAESCIIELR
ncbi:S1 family peptidase [Treponema brennaborense]|uniref:Serine protease n=1 Tax=Treponema brennaborense (strain DSM 12168 / CIP 105900 / DD5/3) TaxID=906968 RepID=F4LQC3_TREBD|nr:serine protease [Treponema brennaborense]AEE16144.1 hypothetical protein Trebr_0702 [Treponema brennaborense DSM 12168]